MKRSTKIISVILSVVMVFSVLPTAFAGTLKTETYNTVEKLIQNDSLGNIVSSLVSDINASKTKVTGTVLRLVFSFLKDDGLAALIAGRDVTSLTDEEAAKVLLDWLDNNLPVWTKDITGQSWYGPVSRLVKVIGITLDLTSVDGVLKTVYSLCDKADDRIPIFNTPVIDLGIANDLKGGALNGLSRSKGDLNVIYGLIQWLNDNMGIVRKALNGDLNLGIVSNFIDLGDTASMIKNVPLLVKSYLYLLIDGHAEAGKFDKDAAAAKGDWGKSIYSDFDADELLAAALLLLIKEPAAGYTPGDVDGEAGVSASDARIVLRAAVGLETLSDTQALAADVDGEAGITAADARVVLRAAVGLDQLPEATAGDGEVTVSKEEADAALKLSFYDLLGTYAGDVYSKFAISWINENLPKFIENISVTNEIKAVFNETIPAVTKGTIAEEIEAAKTSGILSQLNNLIVKLAETVLKPAEFTKLGLTKGLNKGNLNKNLEKICRYILPLMANKTVSDNLGFDFTGFTADKVNKMSVEDIAVAVLKLFYKTWFDSNSEYSAQAVASATTLEQLGVLAVYYTATNSNWLTLNYDFTSLKNEIFSGNKVNSFTTDQAKDLADRIGLGIGIGAMLNNAAFLKYETPAEAASWGGNEYADDITDWALNYIKGIPAVIEARGVTTQRGVYDPYQGNAYNKLSLVLNQLIDFRFLTGAGRDGYAVAVDTLINDAILGNLMNADFEGLLAVLERNNNEGNILNQPVIAAVLGIADRAISCLFKAQ